MTQDETKAVERDPDSVDAVLAEVAANDGFSGKGRAGKCAAVLALEVRQLREAIRTHCDAWFVVRAHAVHARSSIYGAANEPAREHVAAIIAVADIARQGVSVAP